MLDKLLIYAMIGILVAGGAVTTVMYTKIQTQKTAILELTIERDNFKAAYQVKDLEFNNSKASQNTLNDLYIKEKEAAGRMADELEVIRNVPETNNGPVAPVLSNTLDRLRDDN